jgi:drug/metabolite transporter (DMT)-like permease
MPSEPRALDRNAILLVLFLCASWGLNQVLAKVALADMGPITQCAIRSILGSLVVAGYAWRGQPDVWRRTGDFGAGIVAGLLFTLEFILLFLAIEYTSAARATLFVFTAPFFVALGAIAFLPQERLRLAQWLGLGLAFCGVALGLVGRDGAAGLFGDALALASGVAWGATTIVIKATSLRASPPTKVLLYQIVVSAVVSPIFAVVAGETLPTHISGLTVLSLSMQVIWVVGISYGLWFMLLTRYRVGELSAFTFLTPVSGVICGHFLLGDPLSDGFIGALVLVAAGILLVNWPAANPRLAAPAVPLGPE